MKNMKTAELNIRAEEVEAAEALNSLGLGSDVSGYGEELKSLFLKGEIDEIEWNRRLEAYYQKKYNT